MKEKTTTDATWMPKMRLLPYLYFVAHVPMAYIL